MIQMRSYFRFYFVFFACACFAFHPLYSKDLSIDSKARLLAGMKADGNDAQVVQIEYSHLWMEAAAGKTASYYWNLEEWEGGRQNQLNKGFTKRPEVEFFLANHLSEAYFNTRNVLYLFGGPDFCYPDLFFPNMENLILVGQENVEAFPNVKKLYKQETLGKVMLHVGNSFKHIPFRSYFVTLSMKQEFAEYGVTTMLAVSIALSGYHILACEQVFLDDKGVAKSKDTAFSIPGVKIIYKKDSCDRERMVYYFTMNLLKEDQCVQLSRFVKKCGIDSAFYKATSFVTQLSNGRDINQFVLDHAHYIVQGESGIPFSQFNPDLWDIKLFGIYARPYFSSQSIPKLWGYQKNLRDIYIALILLHGRQEIKENVKMIWDANACAEAVIAKIPSHVSWEGILPMHYDYGGQLTEERFKPYTSAVQYAIRKNK